MAFWVQQLVGRQEASIAPPWLRHANRKPLRRGMKNRIDP